MKKLFILLSILAITTPSYACGCSGNSNKPYILLLILLCGPFISSLFANKGKRIIFYFITLGLWMGWIFISIIFSLLVLIISNLYDNIFIIKIFSNDWVMLLFMIFWLLVSMKKLCKYSYYHSRKSQIKENENE